MTSEVPVITAQILPIKPSGLISQLYVKIAGYILRPA